MVHFDRQALPLQLGGRPGISVTQAAHALQSFLCYQRDDGRSVAVIFLDIRNAFYQLFREQLVRSVEEGHTLRTLFDTLHLPEAAFVEFCSLMSHGTAMDDCGAPLYLHTQVQELLNTTWFIVPGSSRLTKARKGSRPGDSAADLLFSVAFRHLLHRVQQRAEDLGIVAHLQWSGVHEPYSDSLSQTYTVSLLGPIWADDLAVLLCHEKAETLVAHTRTVIGHLFDVLTIAGMTPNLAKSKTEVFMDLRGPGSVQVRRQLALNEHILDQPSTWHPDPIRIVGAYRHLGSWIQTGGKLSKELGGRFGIAHATFTQYRGAIFANAGLGLSKKTQLFDSLILSAVLFNSPAWMIRRVHDLEKYHTGLMKLYRRLAHAHFGSAQRYWRDEVVLAHLNLLPPSELLHVHRLRYLQHLVKSGDDTVWAMLQQKAYWWDMVELSLQWLCANVQRPLPNGPIASTWVLWLPLLGGNGRSWKNLLRKAGLHGAGQNRKRALWRQFHRDICSILVESGHFHYPKRPGEWNAHFCACCKLCFKSAAAWSVHAFKKHGRTTPARLVAKGRECTACSRIYHDHVGLINHLKYSPSCYWRLRQSELLVDKQPAMNSRIELDARSDLRCPVLRAQGPLPPPPAPGNIPPTDDQQALLDEWNAVLRRWRLSEGDTGTTAAQLREELRVATLQTFLPGFEIQWLASQWRISLLADAAVQLEDRFDQALKWYLDDFSVSWLLGGSLGPTTDITEPEEVMKHWIMVGNAPRTIPRPFQFKQVVVAHLFSGRRRERDFQSYVEQAVLPESYKSLALSVDIIFSLRWGNLLRVETRELFLHAIRQGVIACILAGPPCESWSIARKRGLTIDSGPRPVRTIQELEGVSHLRCSELAQVTVGNDLLGVSLLLAFAQWLVGSLFILEHPAEPVDDLEAPSIWRTTVLQLLESLPGCDRRLYLQGFFGAASVKPTHLMLVHGPENADSIMEKCQSCKVLPRGGTIGKAADGTFHTAKLKEYPGAFCFAIWCLVEEHLKRRSVVEVPVDCPPDILDRLCLLDARLDKTALHFGPDYNPVSHLN